MRWNVRVGFLLRPEGRIRLDELLSRRRKTRFFLAHPRTIAAFGQECSKRGVYPTEGELNGSKVLAWRGVPLLPSDKIPISESRTSSILALRIGEKDQGVIGLHRTGIPDEVEPSLSVRRMDINESALSSYLVSAYFSAAILVPDALGILENVQIGRYRPRDQRIVTMGAGSPSIQYSEMA